MANYYADGMKKIILTIAHPLIDHFMVILNHAILEKGKCDNSMDLFGQVLSYFSEIDLHGTLAHFKAQGANCDCGVLLASIKSKIPNTCADMFLPKCNPPCEKVEWQWSRDTSPYDPEKIREALKK